MIKKLKYWITKRHIERNAKLIINPSYLNVISIADFNDPHLRLRNRDRL